MRRFGEFSRRIFVAVCLLGAIGWPIESGAADPSADQTAIRDVLTAYHVALTSGSSEPAEALVTADERFAMVESKHTNWGWADYRDNHLAGELEDLAKVDLILDIREIQVDGDLAFASFTYAITPKGNPEMNFGSARATAILIREGGSWLIRLLHTS